VKLAEKLEGPYNIEGVVQPIETKLYEAMEYFQRNLNAVTAKVSS
jgi:Glypican